MSKKYNLNKDKEAKGYYIDITRPYEQIVQDITKLNPNAINEKYIINGTGNHSLQELIENYKNEGHTLIDATPPVKQQPQAKKSLNNQDSDSHTKEVSKEDFSGNKDISSSIYNEHFDRGNTFVDPSSNKYMDIKQRLRWDNAEAKNRAFNRQADVVFGGALGTVANTFLGPKALLDTVIGTTVGNLFDNRIEQVTGRTVGDNVADYFNVPQHSFTRTFITPMANPGYWLYPKITNYGLKKAVPSFYNSVSNNLISTSPNYFSNLPQGTKNIISDITKRPISTLRARLHGEYPITIPERRNYILLRRKAIKDGLQFNYNKYLKTAPTDQFYQPFPKYRDVSRNLAKNFELEAGNQAHYNPSTNEIVIARRNLNSNLPQNYVYKRGLLNLKGVSAHESYHWLMDQPGFDIITTPERALSWYNPKIGYYTPNPDNPNLSYSPFSKNIKRNMLYEQKGWNYDNASNKTWRNCPEEFAAEKANLDVQGISPSIAKLSLATRFRIPIREAASKYNWLNIKKYKAGGKTPRSYTPSNSIKRQIIKWEGDTMKINRSFEAEAKDFSKYLPQDAYDKLTQKQLDGLFSYSYNVGSSAFNSRVVPTLTKYLNGTATAEEVQKSMWAKGDSNKNNKGLRIRRAAERAMFGGHGLYRPLDTPATPSTSNSKLIPKVPKELTSLDSAAPADATMVAPTVYQPTISAELTPSSYNQVNYFK